MARRTAAQNRNKIGRAGGCRRASAGRIMCGPYLGHIHLKRPHIRFGGPSSRPCPTTGAERHISSSELGAWHSYIKRQQTEPRTRAEPNRAKGMAFTRLSGGATRHRWNHAIITIKPFEVARHGAAPATAPPLALPPWSLVVSRGPITRAAQMRDVPRDTPSRGQAHFLAAPCRRPPSGVKWS